jgi:hypothetical protein
VSQNTRDPMLPHGTDKCQCAACGLYFNSTYAFDRHGSGEWAERRCLSATQLREKGWSTNGTGHWITSRRQQDGPAEEDEPEASEEEFDPSEWDACDEHETVFPKGDPCHMCETAEAAERAQGWEPWMVA